MFKKVFWVPYEDSSNYPTLTIAMDVISRYCEDSGDSCTFTEVMNLEAEETMG